MFDLLEDKKIKVLKQINIISELNKRGMFGKTVGTDYICCCPAHQDKNPSWGIQTEEIWRKGINRLGQHQCFSCGFSGDFFSLVAYLDGVTYQESWKQFYKGEQFSLEKVKELKFKNHQNTIPGIKYFKMDYLNQFVPCFDEYETYLIKERRFTKKTILEWNILCCDDPKNKWYKRIVIPVTWKNRTKLVGITGRSIVKDIEKKMRVRKLKNSDVGRIVFGLDTLLEGCDSHPICVEGEIDMIYLRQFGLPAVQSGKNPTDEQIVLLCQNANELTICLDGDVEYSRKDNLATIQKFRKRVRRYIGKVNVILLSDECDPNDLSGKDIKRIFKNFL